MSVLVCLVSPTGAPGVSTSAIALAVTWPRLALLADCDPSGGKIAYGWLGGRTAPDRGLLSFIAATRHDASQPMATSLPAHVQQVREHPHLVFLPGLRSPREGVAIGAEVWERLADTFAGLRTGQGSRVDAICDVGRLSPATPWPLLRAADQVLLVVRPALPCLYFALEAVEWIGEQVTHLDRLAALVVSDGPYPVRDLRRNLPIPVLSELPADPVAARALGFGIYPAAGIGRSPLIRAARTVSQHLSTAEPDSRTVSVP